MRAEAALALGDGGFLDAVRPLMDLKAADPSPGRAPGRGRRPQETGAPREAPVFHRPDHDAELSEEEFRLLRDLIHERFGLYFEDDQRASLRSRLLGRLASLDLVTFEDYYQYLRFGPQPPEELQRMVSHLTNNETYFFREVPQLQVFAEHVLRRLKERKAADGERALRVLSAGCSSGEEAHTLAMIVYDSGQFFWNWDVQITGMDVDRSRWRRRAGACTSTTPSAR